MFSKLMNSYYYGKSGKGDYRREDLPKNRWQLFWEMLRIRFSGICRADLPAFEKGDGPLFRDHEGGTSARVREIGFAEDLKGIRRRAPDLLRRDVLLAHAAFGEGGFQLENGLSPDPAHLPAHLDGVPSGGRMKCDVFQCPGLGGQTEQGGEFRFFVLRHFFFFPPVPPGSAP